MRLIRNCSLIASLLSPLLWAQEAAPRIVEVVFEGNRITQPQTMLREISIQAGDAVDAAALEQSRQSIQDLGLFRSVAVSQTPVEGGMRVSFAVVEKFYLLPYPRVSASVDGRNAYGAELRWNNVLGLNHSLRTLVSSHSARDSSRGRDLRYFIGYNAPFLWDSPYTLALHVGHTETPVEMPAAYDESTDELGFLLSRRIGGSESAASQGWSAGAGLIWMRQQTEGPLAPAPYGSATALVTELGYRDFHDNIYSDGGRRFGARFEVADRRWASDYSYTRFTTEYKQVINLGQAHEDLVFAAELGSLNIARTGSQEFSLGGSRGLRGYERNFAHGDFYYLSSVEYLHPLRWDWLRWAVILEAGNAVDTAGQVNGRILSSLGIGLRARFPRLVQFEFELGLAIPLNQGGDHRLYGSRVGRE